MRHELFHQTDRIVDVFDNLDSQYAIKAVRRRKLFGASNENVRACLARLGSGFRRKLGSDSPAKIGPRFIEQVSVTATDFQQVAAGHSTVLQVAQKALESRAQSRFLFEVAGIRIARFSTLEVGRILINALDGIFGQAGIKILDTAIPTTRQPMILRELVNEFASFASA